MAEVDIRSNQHSFRTAIERGQYKVIRVDGTELTLEGRPSFAEIRRLIGCDSLDTVTIDRHMQTVMLVDDTGSETNQRYFTARSWFRLS